MRGRLILESPGHQVRAEVFMYAKWIPEALATIDSLARLPEPPTRLAIDRARFECMEQWAGSSPPTVEAVSMNGGVGIVLESGRTQVTVRPDGITYAILGD